MKQVCLDGKFIPDNQAVLLAANRSYRYGDGLFETMKWVKGEIPLKSYHMDRLWKSLILLKFQVPPLFTPEKVTGEIAALCRKNSGNNPARIRFSLYRGNGGLYDDERQTGYLIESWPLEDYHQGMNENGLIIGIYPDEQKHAGLFSNLKSANFLVYSMAATYAREQRWNDALVLNTDGGIADSTIANLFLVKNGQFFTPALSEGCVAGVMRRYLLESLVSSGYKIAETRLTAEDLQLADEVFLTNAVRGIRWVKQLGDKTYTRDLTAIIYQRFIQTNLA